MRYGSCTENRFVASEKLAYIGLVIDISRESFIERLELNWIQDLVWVDANWNTVEERMWEQNYPWVRLEMDRFFTAFWESDSKLIEEPDIFAYNTRNFADLSGGRQWRESIEKKFPRRRSANRRYRESWNYTKCHLLTLSSRYSMCVVGQSGGAQDRLSVRQRYTVLLSRYVGTTIKIWKNKEWP